MQVDQSSGDSIFLKAKGLEFAAKPNLLRYFSRNLGVIVQC